ncbi:hypothetical protein CVT25_009118 [Psilocybe cyanescens]|uniref:HD domain-containing protein n=1 Tax=Psilocybe cyanescens TaxID=93625 RepID=A0A409XDM2_PSICY|nr:hypothetical protein CVT25_009118 [Psilocybe cyanescens]
MARSSSPDIEDEIDNSDDEEIILHRQIKDPIHDHIPISPTLSRLIDTRQFQRLRSIKQLGTTSYVWPGVAYLARLMASRLKTSQPKLKITDRDVDCVEIAGLCHDLGHGPWSHVWDGMFIPVALKRREWKHEDGSEMMFDALIEENKVPMPIEDQLFIKALIAGEHSRTPSEKAFLFDIVANKRNGLDVDKLDYITRDSHMIGDPISFSLARLVGSARVIGNEICYEIKDANHIYEICYNRFKLHKSVYNHKAAKAIEYMIIDGLLEANRVMNFAEDVFDPNRYVFLTDEIMSRIESSTDPLLAGAQSIFHRIKVRDLYKCVDYKVIDWPMREIFKEHVTAKRIVEAARNLVFDQSPLGLPGMERSESSSTISSLEEAEALEINDVIVDFSTMHYGMKEKNPLDCIRFYSKTNPKISMKAERGVYSNLMPPVFAEVILRVYTKKQRFYGLVQAGYRAILASLQATSSPPNSQPISASDLSIALDPMAPTPPATEAPTTPKATSRNASFTFGSAATPFSNNEFTTVPPTFAPASPTEGNKKAKGRKRLRDDVTLTPGAANKKRRAS